MPGPDATKVVYWHRELPPIDAEPAGEHLVEATSRGDYAHVLEESIDSRRDDATSEAWLHGQFRYLLLKRPHGPIIVHHPR